MREFAGLKAKAYAYIVETNDECTKTIKKVKGVKNSVVKKFDFNNSQ